MVRRSEMAVYNALVDGPVTEVNRETIEKMLCEKYQVTSDRLIFEENVNGVEGQSIYCISYSEQEEKEYNERLKKIYAPFFFAGKQTPFGKSKFLSELFEDC